MSNYSPAPWVTTEPGGELAILDARGHVVYDFGYHLTTQERANARLIAAAPELLEALKLCQVRVFMAEGCSEAYEAASAAITKAEGE